MDQSNTFSCFLIGADTLLVECAEILIKEGHEILGVVTRTARIASWAKSKQIPVIDLDTDYGTALSNQPFDYFFSITHLEIINNDILNLPRKMAINFHDGPLPRYAGINTPAWALMNQEEEYGISWHVMASGVDQGDILKQRLFTIGPDETSLSINTQCFAAALDSFPELVRELQAGTEQHQAQNLDNRSYFGKFKRPENAGLIDWQQPAAKLEALIRALDFGDYPNPIASPKVLYKNTPFIVSQAKASEETTIQGAGCIISHEESSIKVATGNGVINISQFRTLAGVPLSAGEFAAKYQPATGDYFERLAPETLNQLTELNKQLCRSEDYWCNQLANLIPVEIPYASSDILPTGSHAHLNIETDTAIGASVANFAILLAKLSQKDRFDLSYSDDSLGQQAAGLDQFVSPTTILPINLDTAQSSHDQQTVIANHMDANTQRGTWLYDLVARHNELRNTPELTSGNLLPVGIVITDTIEDFKPTRPTSLSLVLSTATATAKFVYDPQQLSQQSVAKLAEQFKAVTTVTSKNPELAIKEIDLLSDTERQQILVDWNATQVDYDASGCVHNLFEQQAAEHPEKTALVFEDQTLSYAELNQRANQLAAYLRELGIGPDAMVGVNIERSLDLMVATLGVMKAGGAYVPLDPAFPADRLGYMIEDAGMPVILTQNSIADQLHNNNAKVIRIDSDWPTISAHSSDNLNTAIKSDNLAYVIYTSGSTGKPKGVMVEHRNAVNFFVGMDQRIPYDNDSTWLAVTSLSFDISVLELFWTLTRGLKVVIFQDNDKASGTSVPKAISNRPMEFGLFMWGNDDAPGSAKYRLLLDGARYFDENGFNAVWTPERHFSAFGGPYPNPAVTSAAIATITKNIQIRSGSCVSPLHHPVRIAEDWAVVDNLSDGRVGLSFAAGWQPNDFVIMPQNHANNKQVMLDQIEQVKKLWRGESVAFENPMGQMVETSTLPRPVQKELPIWLTTAGNPESYRQAGERGVNVLTHLLGQSVEELSEKIAIYRQARKDAGLDPSTGKVSLMLHTFVGEDLDEVRELIREPMKDYLRSAMKLVIDFAWSFPAFKRPGGADSTPDDIDLSSLSEDEVDTILDFAFERYFETSGLFGTPDVCNAMINRCKSADVDEIACLLDFGVETDAVMDSLPLLKQVRDLANPVASTSDSAEAADQSFAAQIARHQVTHFQCTPSHARMLTFSDEARAALGTIKHMMVGGEAFPTSLAKDLKSILNGSLTNMYGPTETTIWSSTQQIDQTDNITIGRPIANTEIYILDTNKQPVPTGVPGDLYIGGDGVVRGYLNRPDLTAERFIANPFSDQADARIYWTGDMARYRDDGVIEFLGRVDHQVKIRGYRIELGEIETLIGQHPSVQENVLLLREDNPGDQRLVAYLMVNQGNADSAELKSYLRAQLPEYMVPSDFVVLSEFPQTPNGKIDRKALPSPQSMQQAAATEYAAPEDELEKTIANLWQETLNLEKVGINDNFFDLGGHSLLIVKVHSQLKERIEQKVSLTDLYGHPTIKSLCQFLKSGGNAATLQKSNDRAQRRRQMMGRRRR